MKKFAKEKESHFDINLAPMLDVIVSIIPMLLMSVVFVQVNMIETQVPQLVSQAVENNKDEPKATVVLEIGEKDFKFIISGGAKKTREVKIGALDGKHDLEKLYKEAKEIKIENPTVFKVELKPSAKVPLSKLVSVMDKLRKTKIDDGKISFKDVKTGEQVQTDLIFPDIVFASVMSGA